MPSLTCIHMLTPRTAWNVNFNLEIPSFEPDIQGARNLVDLALGSPYATPPPVVFVSPVGVFGSE